MNFRLIFEDWKGVELDGVGRDSVGFENVFETPFHSATPYRQTTTRLETAFLFVVASAQAVELLQLLLGHAAFVVPAVPAHKTTLLPLHTVQRVAVEVGIGGGHHFVDEGFVFVDEAVHLVAFLCMGGSEGHAQA